MRGQFNKTYSLGYSNDSRKISASRKISDPRKLSDPRQEESLRFEIWLA